MNVKEIYSIYQNNLGTAENGVSKYIRMASSDSEFSNGGFQRELSLRASKRPDFKVNISHCKFYSLVCLSLTR